MSFLEIGWLDHAEIKIWLFGFSLYVVKSKDGLYVKLKTKDGDTLLRISTYYEITPPDKVVEINEEKLIELGYSIKKKNIAKAVFRS